MTTSYSALLGLALPVQGELSGTWGDTVNDYITKYLDAAVAGVQTISGTQTSVALSQTNGSTLVSAGAGGSGSSQYMVINCTGTPASLLTISAPNTSKVYVVINATAQSVKLVGVTGPTSGVTMVTGERAICAWNGSDFVKVASSTADGVTTIDFGSTGLTPNTATSGAVTVAGTLAIANGGTNSTATATAGGVGYGTGTAHAYTAASTSGYILTSGGASAPAFIQTLPTANGGTNLTSFTSGGVVYASSSSALATGAALTFDGNNLTQDGSNAAVAFRVNTNNAGVSASNYSEIQLADTSVVRSFWRNMRDGSGSTIFSGGDNIQYALAGSEKMRLNSTGLGIGTTNTSNGRLNVQAGTSATGNSLFLQNVDGTVNPYLQVQHSTSGIKFLVGNSSSGIYNNLIFGSTSISETMRIDAAGNLLVGGTAARGTTVGTAHLDLFDGTAPAGTLTNGVSLYSASGDLKFMDAAGNAYSVGYRNIPKSGATKTTSYTLATTDVGELIEVGTSGAIVVPDATFSTGDAVVIFNNTSGAITLTMSITTAYIGGTDADKATISLATRGICNVLFISGTVCVVTGNVT